MNKAISQLIVAQIKKLPEYILGLEWVCIAAGIIAKRAVIPEHADWTHLEYHMNHTHVIRGNYLSGVIWNKPINLALLQVYCVKSELIIGMKIKLKHREL